MKRLFVFLLCLLIITSVFSQQNEFYKEAIISYKEDNYQQALQRFEKASKFYSKNSDIQAYLISQLYISAIELYKNDFSNALKTINTSLQEYSSSDIKNDSIWGELMNTKALIYRMDGKAKRALQINDSILETQLKNPSLAKYNLVKTYTIRSRIKIDLGSFDTAIYIIEKTLSFPEKSISSHLKAELINNLGTAYLLKDDFNKAFDYYNLAYQYKLKHNANFYDLAISAFNIGVVNEALRDYDNALEFYKKSAEYDLKNQGEKVGFITDIYMAISGVYSKKNDIEKAEEYIQKSLRKAIDTFGENHLNVANIYSWYVRYLKLKNEYDQALEIDMKAFKIREKSYGLYHWFPIQNLTSIAETYTVLKKYSKAQEYYKEALRRAKKMKSKFQEAECYKGIAKVFMRMKEYDKSIDYFNKSYNDFSLHFDVNHPYVAETEILKANVLFLNRNYEEVKIILKKYLKIFDENDYDFPSVIVDVIHLNNKIALINHSDSGDLESLINAYQNLDIMLQNIQKTDKEYSSDASRVNAAQKNTKYIDKAIDLCYQLYKNTKEWKYIEKAFRLSEFNRNKVLIAGIKDEQFKKMAGISDSLLNKENQLKQKLSITKERIYGSQDFLKTDSLMTLRLHYSSQLENLLQKFKKNHPKYYQLKYNENLVSIVQLQDNFLEADTSIIEYFFGGENIFVFVINKDNVSFKKLSIAAQLKKNIKVYRERLNNQQEIKKPANLLYDILLKDLDIKNKLIIISDDVLNFLPFETLYKNEKYLIEDYTISYIGAANLLLSLKKSNSEGNKKRKWIGFAPSYNKNNSLPSNYNEILHISKTMKGAAFLGDDASVENFISETIDASIVHIAAHTNINQDNMMYSKLMFSNNNNKNNELTAAEIYSLSLSSDLVVLSACNTGYGKFKKGEGVMSLSRAFQYAGAKSTVMSLWKVPDKETSIVMNFFYENLKNGFQKDEALQLAKQKYLNQTKDNILKHPYYWAGFVISGNVDSIPVYTSYWWIVSLVFLIIAIIFRKKLFQFFK